jgi:hypothetical protein
MHCVQFVSPEFYEAAISLLLNASTEKIKHYN